MPKERKTMTPVELLRFMQFIQIIAKSLDQRQTRIYIELFPTELSSSTGSFYLGSMTKDRVKSILKEVSICGLCSVEKDLVSVEENNLSNWQVLSEAIELDLKNVNKRWSNLNGFFSGHHDLYRRFNEVAQTWLDEKTNSFEDFLSLSFPSGPTCSTLKEWGLRLNLLQQDLTTGSIYPTDQTYMDKNESVKIFSETLEYFYRGLKHESEDNAVSLPYLAEKVCLKLRITRSNFERLLTQMYEGYNGKMWLGTGLINTYTYEGFVVEKMVILDTFGDDNWFRRRFMYTKTDLPQYSIGGVPRRFIRIMQ